jgi:hypothetical protein
MLVRPSDKLKKTELLLNKHSNPQPPKRSLMQSQEYSNIRRHSVYGGYDYESITVRVSSKEMKSLPKYKSISRQEPPATERKDKDKKNNHHSHSRHHDERYTSPEKVFNEKRAYRYLNMIGKGGFGKVWKVEHLSTGRLFAMKEMSKAMYFHTDSA